MVTRFRCMVEPIMSSRFRTKRRTFARTFAFQYRSPDRPESSVSFLKFVLQHPKHLCFLLRRVRTEAVGAQHGVHALAVGLAVGRLVAQLLGAGVKGVQLGVGSRG